MKIFSTFVGGCAWLLLLGGCLTVLSTVAESGMSTHGFISSHMGLEREEIDCE